MVRCSRALPDSEAELQRTGPVIRSPNGSPIMFSVIANSCLKQLRLYASEFGMSPASRTRVAAAEQPPAEDPFEAYLDGSGPLPGGEHAKAGRAAQYHRPPQSFIILEFATV
jgi:hypothetical protein